MEMVATVLYLDGTRMTQEMQWALDAWNAFMARMREEARLQELGL